MPQPKKAKKAYKPKPVLLPLGIRNEFNSELPLHLAWEALGTANFDFHHLAEIIVHAEIVRDVTKDKDMKVRAQTLFTMCSYILIRFRESQRLGLSGTEMRTIKSILEVTIPHIRTVPNHVIQRALTKTSTFARGNIRA